MDLKLTLSKIEKLEKRILQSNKNPDISSNLTEETQRLIQKLEVPKSTSNAAGLLLEGQGSEKVPQPSNKSDCSTISNDQIEQTTTLTMEKVPMSADKRNDAVEGFERLPKQIKDMMAKTVGLEDGKNATAVIEKLMQENRLFEGDGEDKFSMTAKAEDIKDIITDLEIAEITSFVESSLPKSTRKEPVNEEDANAFYAEVLGLDTFNPFGKPENVPGGFLIRGENKVRPKDGREEGDLLIEALDKKLAVSSVHGKVNVYYILDPTPPSGEDILNDEDELPVLLITSSDISPSTDALIKTSISLIGVTSIAIFTLGSFSFNDTILNKLSSAMDTAGGNVDWFYDLSTPLALSILSIQLAHELGHIIVAFKDGFQIGLPTLVPGFQFGLTGAITPIRSSPRSLKSLFDFALAGPLMGIILSLILLYSGLELTAFMDLSAREQLPSVPVQILRSSTLGGGIIEYLLGDGLLNTPNSDDAVKLHPYAIAGFGGLVTNALSLLPIGNTDGGRISLAFFGRSFSRVAQGFALLLLAISGIFGADESNILLSYALFAQFWQREAEIPCRSEVDELDSLRGFIAIGMSIFVVLTLVPLK